MVERFAQGVRLRTRGSDDDALPCPRLTASGGSNVSTADGSCCDDGSGGSGGSGGECLGPGATGATFSCDTSDEGAMALVARIGQRCRVCRRLCADWLRRVRRAHGR